MSTLFLRQLHFASACWRVTKWVRDSVRRTCLRHRPVCPQSKTSLPTLVLTLATVGKEVGTRVGTFKLLVLHCLRSTADPADP